MTDSVNEEFEQKEYTQRLEIDRLEDAKSINSNKLSDMIDQLQQDDPKTAERRPRDKKSPKVVTEIEKHKVRM